MADNKPDDRSLSDESRKEIVDLFFKRVYSSQRRTQIVGLANYLSDDLADEDAFYAALYHYALEENWPQADEDFETFGIAGNPSEVNILRSNLGLPEEKPRRRGR